MHFASSLESFSAVGTHSLQGARLPHSPHKAMFKRTLPIDKISLYPFSIVSRDVITKGMLFLCAPIIYGAPGKHRELMRQPARVLFLCAKMLNGNQHIPRNLRTVDS